MNYIGIAQKIGELVTGKQEAYGDSITKSVEFLKLLFPSGVPIEKYGDVLLLIRIFDKQCRIAHHKTALDENPFQDIAGYGILGIWKDQDSQ